MTNFLIQSKELLTRLHIAYNNFLIFKVVVWSAKFRLPLLTAFAWWSVTVPFKGYAKHHNGDERKRLLVLDKTGLTGDLLETFPPQNESVYLLTLPRDAVKSVARVMLSKSLSDVSYISADKKINSAKLTYRKYLYNVWRWYGVWLKIKGVLVANYSFYAERELAAAVEEYGVPFIALHKECVAPRIMWQGYEENCHQEKGPFTGRAMTVYNDEWRNIMIRAGIIDANHIEATGCPRIDVYHRLRMQKSKSSTRRLVTLFSFLPTSGLPFIGGGEKEIRWPDAMLWNGKKWAWEKLARNTHQAIIELAKERPDCRFVIKIKVGKAYSQFIQSILTGVLPENARVIQGGEAEKFITESTVITGFNSTTLFEGIAIGKPVVVPRFAEASVSDTAHGILELGEAVFWADSKEHYKELIQRQIDSSSIQDRDLSAAASEVLEKYVGNADALAGKRMREFILSHMN